MRRGGWSALLLVAIIPACVAQTNEHPAVGVRDPCVHDLSAQFDKLQCLELFRKSEFAELTQLFEQYARRSEQEFRCDSLLREAASVFEIADPKWRALFDRWVKEHSTSFVPYLVRGLYLEHCGWEARGTRFASETSAERFQRMDDYFDNATTDAEAAIQRDPQCVLAYQILIRINMARGNREANRQLMDRVNRICPACLEVRASYMLSLCVRWGGSTEEMEEFLMATKPLFTQNPRLQVLAGYRDWEMGKQAEREDYLKAIRCFDRALAHGDHWWFLRERARDRYRVKDYAKALGDVEKWLTLRPQHPDALRWKAMTLHALGQTAEAIRCITLAKQLDHVDPKVEEWFQFLIRGGTSPGAW